MKKWMTLLMTVAVWTAGHADEGAWTALFDGSRDDGDLKDNWTLEEGVLGLNKQGGGLLTRKTYQDFELRFDWKISPGGNSGIKYRYAKYNAGTNGPEYQMMDDKSKSEGKESWSGTASLYLLSPRAASGALKKAGEWNTGRIVAKGTRIEHWLNGTKVVDVDLAGPAFLDQVKKTKFKGYEGYGTLDGQILFTDHNSPVWFRNIRIREF